jgi:LPS export ABC transporter protein LptC
MNLKNWMFLAVAACIMVAACTGSETENRTPPILDSELPDQTTRKSQTYLTKHGRRTALIRSESLKVFNSKDVTLLYDLDVEFFDSSGAHVSSLIADSGRVLRQKTVFEARGDVVAWTEDGKKLETDSLWWHSEKERVVTDGFVRAYRTSDTLEGWGLETDRHLRNMIIRNVKGSFSEPQSNSE